MARACPGGSTMTFVAPVARCACASTSVIAVTSWERFTSCSSAASARQASKASGSFVGSYHGR